MKMGEGLISSNHWAAEDYRERMTVKEWRAVLLAERDIIFFRGHSRRLVAKNIGAGVVEVSKAPEERSEK
jgi:hypothetical protein